MNQEIKNQIFSDAKKHVKKTQIDIKREIKQTKDKIERNKTISKSRPSAEQQLFLMAVLKHQNTTLEQLSQLYPSPYFIRCDVLFKGEKEQKTVYFAKFNFSKKLIYSWVAPASVIRFEEPGSFSYRLPDNKCKSGKLLRKDQFMIVDGKIIFMSSESSEEARTLIYQKGLIRKKTEFALPEIVELMEKAQDTVIRVHYREPFLIVGPAGSGKTTLALHRVAYLVQSPDLTDKFIPEKIIVFVQDESTREYFNALLPDLGIDNVTIITFAEWSLNILKIKNFKFIVRYGKTEKEKDLYEHIKHQALKHFKKASYSKNIFETLKKIYGDYFSDKQIKIFERQKKDKHLDRFDLTILLQTWVNSYGNFTTKQTKYQQTQNFRTKKKIIQAPLKYPLIIIDEAENYLAEQIRIISSLIDEKTNALLFVGDLSQQSFLYTIKNWQEVGQSFKTERKATLEKIYRSTKQILEYIRSIGYKIEIPKGIKMGKPVKEKICQTQDDEIKYINKIIGKNQKSIIGILTKNTEYLTKFKRKFNSNKNVKVLTINESQGVEFDIVFIVGINKQFFIQHSDITDYPQELLNERMSTDRDILYLALTRAMSELHILGNCLIKEII